MSLFKTEAISAKLNLVFLHSNYPRRPIIRDADTLELFLRLIFKQVPWIPFRHFSFNWSKLEKLTKEQVLNSARIDKANPLSWKDTGKIEYTHSHFSYICFTSPWLRGALRSICWNLKQYIQTNSTGTISTVNYSSSTAATALGDTEVYLLTKRCITHAVVTTAKQRKNRFSLHSTVLVSLKFHIHPWLTFILVYATT